MCIGMEKSKRAGRKMGHINLSAKSNKKLAKRLKLVAELLPLVHFQIFNNMRQHLLGQFN